MKTPKILCLTGPSGTGKTAIAKVLVEKFGFAYPRSAVTRPRREGEDNAEYEFLSVDEWWDWHEIGRFVEWTSYRGNMYGMMAESFDGRHDKLVAVLDRNGTQQIQDQFADDVKSVLVLPPNVQALVDRLTARGDAPESVSARLENVYEEMRVTPQFDYVFVNTWLAGVVGEINAYIIKEW